MARTRALVLFVAVLLVLSGCSAFFDFNAFSSLDKPAAPSASRYQGVDGLSNLRSDLGSAALVNALKNDPTTVAAIEANLVAIYNVTTGPLTTPDQQTAAILYSDLALKSTSGDQLVNNIVASVLTNAPGNIPSILASIVPADVAADSTKFANMVAGLLAANTVYQVLGATLNPASPPPGMNMGDTAQKAAVAFLMERVVAAVSADVNPLDPVAEMFNLVNNQPNNISANLSTTPSNPLNPLPGWLANIFDAAGAPYPA